MALAFGTTLMIDGRISKSWAFTVSTGGVVYGAIGVFVLGVRLDAVLLAGAVVLAASRVTSPGVPR